MIEHEEPRADIDRYLMERFKYRKSLVCLTVDNIISTRRNSRVDLYLSLDSMINDIEFIAKHYKPHLNGERILFNHEVSKKLN